MFVQQEVEQMNMTETANMIEFLQAIGWDDAQITNFQLCVEGRRTIKTAAKKHKEKDKEHTEK